jgi:hypothetical protein
MSGDEQEIRPLVAPWTAATKAGDIEAVLSLTAEDVVFLMSAIRPWSERRRSPQRRRRRQAKSRPVLRRGEIGRGVDPRHDTVP